MILESLRVDAEHLRQRTGWDVKPEGACKGDYCVPLPAGARDGDLVDVEALADRLGMPLVEEAAHGLWALGPETGLTGRALTSVEAPEIVLPDRDGNPFDLASLRGRRVLLVAWASW